MTHNLKIKKIFWQDIISGIKTFELRKDDRNYQVGDEIHFTVIDDLEKTTEDNDHVFVITYILKDVPQYGLADGYAILGIKTKIAFAN